MRQPALRAVHVLRADSGADHAVRARTRPLTEALADTALTLAGRPGSRLAAKLSMPCCRDVLTGLIRTRPVPGAGHIEVLGVDDFAVRRGQSYDTILIDMATHRPVDVLPDRESGTLAAWLKGHPEVQTVCRDRAGAYAEGIRTGAPQAIQVAGRFHLWENLCEAAGKTVAAHHHCLRAAAAQAGPAAQEPPAPISLPAPVPAAPPGRARRLAERTRTRYAEVQECLARGLSRSAVSRELNLGIQTVRRFANATCAEELPGKAGHRSTKLDPYLDLVSQRWNEGVTSAGAITAELRALGFKGGAQTVRRCLQPFRLPGTSRSHPDPNRRNAAPATPAVPKPRTISKALLIHPDRLTEDDALIVKNATAGCAHLERLHPHVRSFAKMMAQRRGNELPAWLDAVEAGDLPELHSLATGMRHDLPAIINGLTLLPGGACGAAVFSPQAGHGRTGRAVACRASRCARNASRAAAVPACHFGSPAVMTATRGQAAKCHRRLNRSMMKPAPAAAISRSSLSLAILRAPSASAVPPSPGVVAMAAIMHQHCRARRGPDTTVTC